MHIYEERGGVKICLCVTIVLPKLNKENTKMEFLCKKKKKKACRV